MIDGEIEKIFEGNKGCTAFNVIGKAIRVYFKDDEEKMRVPWSRQMAEIIDSGFLDSILAHSEKLIKRNTELVNQKERELRWIRGSVCSQQTILEELKKEIEENQKYLENIKKTIETLDEPDKVLASAERAYYWMLKQTGNKQIASKAFNSYLIGQNATHEKFEPTKGDGE